MTLLLLAFIWFQLYLQMPKHSDLISIAMLNLNLLFFLYSHTYILYYWLCRLHLFEYIDNEIFNFSYQPETSNTEVYFQFCALIMEINYILVPSNLPIFDNPPFLQTNRLYREK